MTGKEELEMLRQHKAVIDRIAAERAELEDVLYKCTSRSDGMPKSGGGDRMGALVARVADLQDDLAAELDKYLQVRDLVTAKIGRMKDRRFRDVLVYRYVAMRTWENVAECMGRDVRYVYKLHGWALIEYERL